MTPASSDPIAVALAADDAYAMPLAVAVRSLLDNLEPGRRVRLFVVDGGLRAANRERLLASWPLDSWKDRLEVEWLHPDISQLAGVEVFGHVPVASYFRLLVAELLPPTVARVIYLDCDLVVLGDLAELWATDLRGHPIAAAADLEVRHVSAPNGLPTWGELRLPVDRKYFNAGVLLLDLAAWRRDHLARRILDYLVRHRGRIRWWDQDGLNAILGGDCLELEPRWNVAVHGGQERDPEIQALLRSPSICHFSSRVKPWHLDCDHPRKDLFFRYLASTAWAAFRPSHRSDELPPSRILRKLARYWLDRGPLWTALHLLRAGGPAAARIAEPRMLDIEQRRFLLGPETVSSRPAAREEHSPHPDPAPWESSVVERVLVPHVRAGSRVLEIGCGGGRWTKHLQAIAEYLVLVDRSERSLDLCRRRFADATNIEYFLAPAAALDPLPDRSIDFVWSYDTFVRLNPNDTNRYLAEIARVLRPGGIAAIHHPGTYREPAPRSHMNAAFFADLVRRHGMEILAQDDRSPHRSGDVISIFRREPAP